jgi:cupin 2 domain-containing protein
MIPRVTNLIAPSETTAPQHQVAETIHPLINTTALRLEQIISRGRPSAPGHWYDQPDDEWVMLMRGTATLDFGDDGALELKAGDSLTIAAHQKHRVAEVSYDAVWLALHFKTTV